MTSLAGEQMLNNLGQRLGADASINDALAERIIGMQMEHEANEAFRDAEADSVLVAQVEEQEADEKEPLTIEQIIVGDAQIAAYHPLSSVPIEKIFPLLCCCFQCCRAEKQEEDEEEKREKDMQKDEIKNRKQILDQIIKQQNGAKYKGTGFVYDAKEAQGLNPHPEEQDVDGSDFDDLEEDEKQQIMLNQSMNPLQKLGLGISVWLDLLTSLCRFFFFFAILAFFMCKILGNASIPGIQTDPKANAIKKTADLTLGNLQGAQTTCYNQFFNVPAQLTQKIECPKGKIAAIRSDYIGLIAQSKEDDRLLKLNIDGEVPSWGESNRKFGYNYCGETRWLEDHINCDEYIDKDKYVEAFNAQCHKKKNAKGELETQSKCDWALKQTKTNIMKDRFQGTPVTEADKKHDRCTSDKAQIYIQVQCVLDGKEVEANQIYACIMVMFTMIICSMFFELMKYRQEMADMQSKQYDMSTCTAADYSIRVNITTAWFNTFKEHNAELVANGKKQKCMFQELIREFETDLASRRAAIVKSRTEVIEDEEANEMLDLPPTDEIKVATIRFAYKNGTVIKELMTRGKLVGMDADYEKVDACDQKINKLIEDNVESLHTPVCAFITFTTQEAKERAMKYYSKYNEDGTSNSDYDPIISKDQEMEVVDAPEPSNILWENLQVSKLRVKVNQGVVYFAIFVILAIVFGTMTLLKKTASDNQKMYPPRMPCAGIDQLYTDGKTPVIENEWYIKAATEDKKPTYAYSGGGYYQCYCKAFPYKDIYEKIFKVDNHICYDYYYDKVKTQSLNYVITGLVTAINIGLRYIVEGLVNKIGYDTDSERVSTIMVITFVSMFVNTGVITLLVNANFAFMDIPFYWLFFRQEYTDFNRDWYLTIAPVLIQTMIIAAFGPIIELMIGLCMRSFKMILDSGFPCCPRMRMKEEVEYYNEEDEDQVEVQQVPSVAKDTKKTTLYQYVELYVGPVYLPHSKYAQILNIIWVTFMFGLFIPAMWIVAFGAIVIFLLLESGMLAYYYRKPPMFDAMLDIKANNLLRYCPIITFAVGYWALGNMQMFHNRPPVLEFINRPANPKHELVQFHLGVDQSHLALLCFLIWGCRIFIDIILRLRKLCTCCQTEEEQIEAEEKEDDKEFFNENLPNYWAAIPGHQQMQMYATELYDRRICGVKSLNKEAMKMIQKTRRDRSSKKYLTGAVNYDMLNQRKYNHELQYDVLLDRKIDYGDDGPEFDENNHVIVPENLNKQSPWMMSDQIRQALHFNENFQLPKNFQKRGADTKLMNTGVNMIAAHKRKKQLEQILKMKKKASKKQQQ